VNCATTHLGTKKKLEIHKEGKHGGGRINTGAGFMMVFNPVPDDSPTVPQDQGRVHKIILKCNRTDAKNVEGRKEEEKVKEDKYGK
jgi:hypothetical protein